MTCVSYHFLFFIMQPLEPQSPFLKFVPQNEQDYFDKKIKAIFQTDKENVTSLNPKIQVNKMLIGDNQIDEYLVEVDHQLKLRKENIRDLFKGIDHQNSPKRVIIGLLGHMPYQAQPIKSIITQKPISEQKDELLMNLNILLKLHHEEYPYVSMFASNCVMEILKLYIRKQTEIKEEDLTLRWKYGFYLENSKIGEVLVFHDVKGDDLFTNIAIRIKLGVITKNERQFVGDLLQELGSQLNVSKNLRQTAAKIHQTYQSELMFLGEQVLIRRRQPNQWQDMVSGKFIKVNEIGNAILQGLQGNEEEIEDGYMQLKEDREELIGDEDEVDFEGIAI